jgi:transcriptional regulator with GAF, ATPase, and Fis domain
MADQRSKEARRVLDALDSLSGINDPHERALAIGEVMQGWNSRSSDLRELRRTAVRELMERDKLSVRKAAAVLGLTPGQIQSILSGYTGSGSARKKKPDPDPPAE